MLSISREARNDLFEIWDYIADNSVARADNFVHSLSEKFELIADNPEVGRLRDDLPFEGLRSWAYRAYIVFYIADRDSVEIVRVFHAARNYKDLI